MSKAKITCICGITTDDFYPANAELPPLCPKCYERYIARKERSRLTPEAPNSRYNHTKSSTIKQSRKA